MASPERKPIKNTADLADALLVLATEASNKQADVKQGDLLCKATDTLIKLTRLQLDMLPPATPPNNGHNADKRTSLLEEQATIKRHLGAAYVDGNQRKRLSERLGQIESELEDHK